MILYVPFARNQAGDLVGLVELWKKNHTQNSNHPIYIIYYGENFDFDSEPHRLSDASEVYICAHGLSDENRMVVSNNANLSKADLISMKTVSERFNQDFSYISYAIFTIHLYCCGNQKKNKEMALLMRADLVRPDVSIQTYDGDLCVPDQKGIGILYSFRAKQFIPLEYTGSVLYPREVFKEQHYRVSIKESTVQKSLEESREKRRNSFFAHSKAARESKVLACRTSTELEPIVNTGP